MVDSKKFVPITGLDNLSEAEKHEYYVNCCEHYGIPPELNLLQFMWLDSNDGTGEKHLVLYAKRGATDLMRGVHGISVDEIRETLGDGFVMFTAKGHDKTGRTDVAVGSANIKGLGGKSLDNSIMTAQTRATRRLTLQFVGGGLLDESEVQALVGGTVKTSDVPVGPVAVSPTVAPSTDFGRDITEAARIVKEIGESVTVVVGSAIPDSVQTAVDAIAERARSGEIWKDTPIEVLATEPKKRRGRRRTVSLEPEGSPVVERRELPRTEPLKSIEDVTHQVIRDVAPTEAQLAAREALASIVPPFVINVDDDTIKQLEEALAKAKAKKAAEAVKPPPVPASAPAQEPAQSVPPPQPLPIVGLPTEAQAKEFKTRLFAYTNDVLRKGNMKGSEGIGGIEYKVRAFVRLFFPQTPEAKNLTVDQWNTLLGYLDEKYQELGAEGLVRLINDKIGVKE